MKKAFTMLELVFVVVIIGILSTFISPNFQRDTLTEAANQIVSHIRYTQHLAMMDNKFDVTDASWFQGRWQIRFFEDVTFTTLAPNKTYSDIWSYAIYADSPNYTHLPNLAELARNPQNRNQFMSGGYNNTLHVEDANAMKEMRLNESYGIQDIRFKNGCRGGINHIEFDHIGRPFNNYITVNNPYGVINPTHRRLLNQRCDIDLCLVDPCSSAVNTEIITISIEPETGYTHIL